MRRVDALHQLQELDRQVDAARASQARLSAQLGDRAAVAERETQVRALRERVHGLETQQRDLELLAEQRRSKIEADEKKLYGGRVTNPKELTSLQEEVAQDKRQLSTVEDQLLEVMEQLEQLSGQLAEAESALQRETAAWQTLQDRLKAQISDTTTALQRLTGERARVATLVSPQDQATYESLRRQKGGTAVAVVSQRTCQACRVGLTPSQEQRARLGAEIVTCNSCGRILYVPLA